MQIWHYRSSGGAPAGWESVSVGRTGGAVWNTSVAVPIRISSPPDRAAGLDGLV